MFSNRPTFAAVALCGALALVAVLPAAAEHMRFWRLTSYEDFDKGTPKGVALRSDGRLVPAPRTVQFTDPNLAYLWALVADSKGRVYAAGGSTAKVLRLDEKGAATTVFESSELAAQALAVDAQDNLYVATSPDGKVYKVTPGGEHNVFFDPQRKYIWTLIFGRDGRLYVGTGDKGEIFAVTPDGKGQVYYKSEETHVRSLAVDGSGRLYAGTEPNGLVVRVDAPPAKGGEARGFVVYETSKKEITSLLTDAQGNLYAAAVGDKTPSLTPAIPPITPQPAPAPQVQTTPGGAMITFSASPQFPFTPFPAMGGGSEVYQFPPDGAPSRLWGSRDELVYALAFSPERKLLLGTGGRGVIYRLEGNDVFTNIAKTFSGQVTCFARAGGGKIVAAAANPGKIFSLGPDVEPEGSYESSVFDARLFSSWGRLTWWGDPPQAGAASGHIAFYLRSGNTSDPNAYWSPWAGPFHDPDGEAASLPSGRFVQWKAVFHDAPAEANISWVSVAYLPKNVAPVIDSILVQNPGIRVQSSNVVSIPGQPQPVQLRTPPPPPLPGLSAFPQPPPPAPPQKFEAPPQGFAQRGWQSVLWGAHDENDDDLVYTLYYRGERETAWKLLKDKVENRFYSWDTTSMPDGAYYLKIVASDAPSNPPEEALTAERISDRFTVDNAPPDILNLRAAPAGDSAEVRFEARDAASALTRAEWNLDGGDWKLVLPAGRLGDARQESYKLMLRGLAPGEHTVAVRLTDEFDNQSVAKTVFRSGAASR
jgi:sugar lactone lactonase YvrE